MKEDAIAIKYRDRTSLKARKLHVCECVCTRVQEGASRPSRGGLVHSGVCRHSTSWRRSSLGKPGIACPQLVCWKGHTPSAGIGQEFYPSWSGLFPWLWYPKGLVALGSSWRSCLLVQGIGLGPGCHCFSPFFCFGISLLLNIGNDF